MLTESTRSASASRLCKDASFQQFMREERKPIFRDYEYNAVNALRYSCGVRELKELDSKPEADEAFKMLMKRFRSSRFFRK